MNPIPLHPLRVRPSLLSWIPVGFAIAVASWHGASVLGQTSNAYPMLMSLKPAAAVVGQTTEHELSARYNLAGASAVWISGQGVSAEILPNAAEKPEDRDRNDVQNSKCSLRITVHPEALPGMRDLRIMTPHGASTVGQLVITREPVISEQADNDRMENAQSALLPASLCGTLEKAEDLDFYRFQITAPTQVVFAMTSQRLQNRLHDMQVRVDPLLTLRNAQGVTLASSDNALAGDPVLPFAFAETGEYFLEVRDVRYQGNVDWTYVVECMMRPFGRTAHPLAFVPGQESKLEWVGLAPSESVTMALRAPEAAHKAFVPWAPTIGESVAHPISILASTDPIVHESSDSDTSRSNEAHAPPVVQAQPAEKAPGEVNPNRFAAPSMLCGRIDTPGQIDRYSWESKAQQKWSLEVFSRRLGSSLDAKLRILNAAGQGLAEADDMIFERVLSADAMLENWNAPADGVYIVEVRDLHGRGGKDFPYAIHVSPAEPYFLLEADTDKTILAPGLSSVIYVKAHRRNGFVGQVQLEVEGLPAGVRAHSGRILASGSDGAILLTADDEAPQAMSNIRIRGKGSVDLPDGSQRILEQQATFLQEVYLPGGGRGHYPVDSHAVSVSHPQDIRKVSLSQNAMVLHPGESKRIDVTVERANDYQGNITLDAMLQHLEQPYGNPLPRGVTMDLTASKTLLTAGETAGHLTFKAAPDAPTVEKHLVPITVHISINFVMKHTFSGEPFTITVE